MAENENRGGFRPTAPQNNPANINALGGNGQSGMNTDYTGFAYGENKAVNEQRKSAPITTSAPSPRAFPDAMPQTAPIIPLGAPTQFPEQPVTAGAALGPGPGEEILNLPPVPLTQTMDSGIQALRSMYLLDPNNEDLRRMIEYVDRTGATS